mmetsp:Transcript_47125/g.86468  ORF Transcript_47125/g.86468 Transcript_47125/m.86468 type:complete len:438 (-) Transcript_47125:89-1402(-)
MVRHAGAPPPKVGEGTKAAASERHSSAERPRGQPDPRSVWAHGCRTGTWLKPKPSPPPPTMPSRSPSLDCLYKGIAVASLTEGQDGMATPKLQPSNSANSLHSQHSRNGTPSLESRWNIESRVNFGRLNRAMSADRLSRGLSVVDTKASPYAIHRRDEVTPADSLTSSPAQQLRAPLASSPARSTSPQRRHPSPSKRASSPVSRTAACSPSSATPPSKSDAALEAKFGSQPPSRAGRSPPLSSPSSSPLVSLRSPSPQSREVDSQATPVAAKISAGDRPPLPAADRVIQESLIPKPAKLKAERPRPASGNNGPSIPGPAVNGISKKMHAPVASSCNGCGSAAVPSDNAALCLNGGAVRPSSSKDLQGASLDFARLGEELNGLHNQVRMIAARWRESAAENERAVAAEEARFAELRRVICQDTGKPPSSDKIVKPKRP